VREIAEGLKAVQHLNSRLEEQDPDDETLADVIHGLTARRDEAVEMTQGFEAHHVVERHALFSNIPMKRWMLPQLHDQLGLCLNVVQKLIQWARENVEKLPQQIANRRALCNLHTNNITSISRDLSDWRSKIKKLKAFIASIKKFRKTFAAQSRYKTDTARAKVAAMVGRMNDQVEFICDGIIAAKDESSRQQEAQAHRQGVAVFLNYGREALKDADNRIKRYQADIRRNIPIISDERKALGKEQKQLRKMMKTHESKGDLAREIDAALYKNGAPRNLYYKGSINGHAARSLSNVINEIFRMAKTQNKQFNDSELLEFEGMFLNFQRLWRKLDLPLTVKFHHIEDHVVPEASSVCNH
jgi:hypothetical protein